MHAVIPADRSHGCCLICGCAYEGICLFDGRRYWVLHMHVAPLARGYNYEGLLQITDHYGLHVDLFMIS